MKLRIPYQRFARLVHCALTIHDVINLKHLRYIEKYRSSPLFAWSLQQDIQLLTFTIDDDAQLQETRPLDFQIIHRLDKHTMHDPVYTAASLQLLAQGLEETTDYCTYTTQARRAKFKGVMTCGDMTRAVSALITMGVEIVRTNSDQFCRAVFPTDSDYFSAFELPLGYNVHEHVAEADQDLVRMLEIVAHVEVKQGKFQSLDDPALIKKHASYREEQHRLIHAIHRSRTHFLQEEARRIYGYI